MLNVTTSDALATPTRLGARKVTTSDVSLLKASIPPMSVAQQ